MIAHDEIVMLAERDDDTLDTEEAARFLGCSASKLTKNRVTGDGPIFCKLGRSVRYLRRDLRAFRDSRRRRSTSNDRCQPTVGSESQKLNVSGAEPDGTKVRGH
jgi:hypothetical protein